jgi:hypothetical protein
MVAPSDEMNEELHLRPLSIFNVDDSVLISKKTQTKNGNVYISVNSGLFVQ